MGWGGGEQEKKENEKVKGGGQEVDDGAVKWDMN